ncbi:hypothetical protein [Massilia genomosp. 1]|uniref:Uncharacterized protein n=1 Tax=Massilia genomosp. 1 TaxID=2609280 RepID=A0ABX0MW84_9BURK|nr:hypothetical protein [Massilia genomosp. 1]NHZ67021.1 hypothetical protein [Massilia genomosp. 1]
MQISDTAPVTQFAQTFKRTALIRSKSYDAYTAGGEAAQLTDNRGVYAVPEEDKLNWPDYGEKNPAELVSAPHRLTNDGLRFLRASIRKVKNPSGSIADRIFTVGLAALDEEQKRSHLANVTFHGQAAADQVTTQWNKGGSGAGAYQTTIGIPVDKLMACARNDDGAPDVLQLLVYNAGKRQQIRQLLRVTHHLADTCLTGTNFTPAETQGFELALLADLFAQTSVEAKGSGMEKDALGMNLKGYTSFAACGFPEERWTKTDPDTLKLIVADYLKTNEVSTSVKKVLGNYNFEKIGRPDLSVQASVEKGPTIANFTHASRLFTVIEARESNAEINDLMKKLTDTPPQLAGDQSNAIVTRTLDRINSYINFIVPAPESSASSSGPVHDSGARADRSAISDAAGGPPSALGPVNGAQSEEKHAS